MSKDDALRAATVWVCECGTVHSWIDHDLVAKVERHDRYAMEDVWWCPGCGREHRTTDGSMLGRSHKGYRQTSLGEVLDERLERLTAPRRVHVGYGGVVEEEIFDERLGWVPTWKYGGAY